ncbi:hypothetical protein ASD11_07330 [Aeromicrobium sp. Root495]|uniref:hypothetical protein n=1 Tax=Aeromicrobium sp. Root495 TaxID=1736550 RepID=UPI0006F1F366|nr:hypothetical protein [Aeromicrobium sp. Root495]KQY59373.1 hypothetical protein ASD11_07330 [Aeromicrobium sp. Root495]
MLAELLVDARGLVELEWIMIPAFTTMETKDLIEFVDTDSGKQMAERNHRLRRSLTEARLLVAPDSDLGRALMLVHAFHISLPEEAHGPVQGSSKSREQKMDGVGPAFTHLRKLEDAVSAVEKLALAELARLAAVRDGTRRQRRA